MVMRRIVVSIVSHGHQDDIIRSGLLDALDGVDVILRENIPDLPILLDGSQWIVRNLKMHGFGANHNRTFEAAALRDGEWFVVCNPDIKTDANHIRKLVQLAENEGERLAAPRLWNSRQGAFDHNVRPRPTLLSLALSFTGFIGRSRYSSAKLATITHPDWASGALIAIRADLYRELGGFDEKYLMYMEDVDLCDRAARLGSPVRYYACVEMIHDAARANRKLLSRSFLQHFSSALRYFISARSR